MRLYHFTSFALILVLFGDRCSASESLAKTTCVTADNALKGVLRVFKDEDGGVYALKVTVANMSTNDLTLMLSDIPALNLDVMLNVGGKRLQKEMPKYKNFEGHTVEMKLKRASNVEWFVRLFDRIADANDVPNSASGFLSVLFRCGYRPSDVDETVDPSAVKFATFNFILTPITVTSNALSGNAAEKFERRERR